MMDAAAYAVAAGSMERGLHATEDLAAPKSKNATRGSWHRTRSKKPFGFTQSQVCSRRVRPLLELCPGEAQLAPRH